MQKSNSNIGIRGKLLLSTIAFAFCTAASKAPKMPSVSEAIFLKDEITFNMLIQIEGNANKADVYGIAPIQFALVVGDEKYIQKTIASASSFETKMADRLLAKPPFKLDRRTRSRLKLVWGLTPIEAALRLGRQDVARKLKGLGTNIRSGVISDMAANGDVEGIKKFLPLVKSLEEQNEREETPIFAAIRGKQFEALKFIVSKGGNMNARMSFSDEPMLQDVTPLLYAAWHNNARAISFLIKNGANGETDKTKGGCSALQVAAKGGNSAILNQLAKTGVSSEPCNKGKSLVWHATMSGDPDTIRAAIGVTKSTSRLELIIGNSPFFANPKALVPNVTKMMVQAGISPNGRNKSGQTPLMLAAKTGSYRAVKGLIAAGAAVNARDTGGRTPLFYAGMSGSMRTIQMLTKSGADATSRDLKCLMASDYAAAFGQKSTFKYLQGLLSNPENSPSNNSGSSECLGSPLISEIGSTAKRFYKLMMDSNRIDQYGLMWMIEALDEQKRVPQLAVPHLFKLVSKRWDIQGEISVSTSLFVLQTKASALLARSARSPKISGIISKKLADVVKNGGCTSYRAQSCTVKKQNQCSERMTQLRDIAKKNWNQYLVEKNSQSTELANCQRCQYCEFSEIHAQFSAALTWFEQRRDQAPVLYKVVSPQTLAKYSEQSKRSSSFNSSAPAH